MTGDDRAPLRVLQVAPRYLPDLGGTETHVREVSTRLAACPDLDVAVLASDRSGDLPEYEMGADFPVFRRRAWPKQRDLYFAPGMARVITRCRWDLVHVQGVHTMVPVVAMAAARRAGLPYVVTFHTGGHSSAVRTALRGVQWKALAPLLRDAAKLVAVSTFEQRLFARATGVSSQEIAVIRNGGGLPVGAPGEHQQVPGRIVSSGRLEKYKGHHLAIAALPWVQRRVPGAHLEILGSGPYESELRLLAARSGVSDDVTIRCVEPHARAEMAQALGDASLMAALSEYEAHPVAVMEALSLGVPVIGYDVAGIGDLVAEGLVEGLALGSTAEETGAAMANTLLHPPERLGAPLPTWEGAALELAAIYRSAGRHRERAQCVAATAAPAAPPPTSLT